MQTSSQTRQASLELPPDLTPPEPEFCTAALGSQVMAYGWKCDHLGILAFGDTRVEARQNWLQSITAEIAADPTSLQLQ